ncbi:hypothetical protein MBLNU459_g8419t1 [Dothideomycetes sp. NU459]
MPPKKSKASKAKAKAAEAEPVTESASEEVQEEVPASKEDAPEQEPPKVEDAPAPDTEREPNVDAQPEAEQASSTSAETTGKGAKAKKRKADTAHVEDPKGDEESTAHAEPDPKEESKPADKSSKKRKVDKPKIEGERKSGRSAPKTQPTQEKLLNYLLSDAAESLCRSQDEADDIETRGADIKTYASTALSPFEDLLCAVVLSRPISHRLGLRTIRTILNAPYTFTTPKAIIEAGDEKRHQALFDAKTQHKGKTAEQIGLIAEVVATKFGKDDTDTGLEKLRDEANKGWDSERDLLQANIKGLGKAGLDIFFRRVQWLWTEAFPFVDERTARGLDKLGLPKNPDQLVKTLDQHWAKLETQSLVKGDEKTKKRRAFVILCERATSADLEGKSEALLEAAVSS